MYSYLNVYFKKTLVLTVVAFSSVFIFVLIDRQCTYTRTHTNLLDLRSDGLYFEEHCIILLPEQNSRKVCLV